MSEQLYLIKDEQGFAQGVCEDVSWIGNSLQLKDDCYTGEFIAPEQQGEYFDRLICGWNAQTPPGTAVQVLVRIKTNDQWGAWLDYGLWNARCIVSGKTTHDEYAELRNGVITAQLHFAKAFQVRAVLHANERGESPLLRLLSISIQYKQQSRGEPLYHRSIPVPGYAALRRAPQLRDTMDLCIALTSILNRRGEDLLPEEVWHGGAQTSAALAAAYAGAMGYECYPVFCDVACLKAQIKRGFSCAVRLTGRWVCVRGFDTDAQGVELTELLDSSAADDACTLTSESLEMFCERWTGLALIVNEKQKQGFKPERIAGEVRLLENGRIAVFVHGEPYEINSKTTVCFTKPDGNAYATTAHKRFYYPEYLPDGTIHLQGMVHSGEKITLYAIRCGMTVVCSVTIPEISRVKMDT